MIKIFIGSVPFGCDNIGDEAILEATIKTLRKTFPGAQICVGTARPAETSKKFGCRCVGLFGFGKKDSRAQEAAAAIKESDLYLWAGATGLSDYPHAALEGLETAQKFGVKTILWNVGMDADFNPALFRLGGRKAALCRFLGGMCLGKINFAKIAERRLENMARKRLKAALEKCDAVILRDKNSLEKIEEFAEKCNAFVGADPATALKDSSIDDLWRVNASTRCELLGAGEKIGICISAQRPLKHPEKLAQTLDELVEGRFRKIFAIPMNPETDLNCMMQIASKMKNSNKVFAADGVRCRKGAQECARRCDAVISSRLHMLILSANAGTPIVGIERGSKIANFLGEFGLAPAAGVESVDFSGVKSQTELALCGAGSFKINRGRAYEDFSKRHRRAAEILAQAAASKKQPTT